MSISQADYQASLVLENTHSLPDLFGENDLFLTLIEKRLAVKVFFRGSQFTISGHNQKTTDIAKDIVIYLYNVALQNRNLPLQEFNTYLTQKVEKSQLLEDLPKEISIKKKESIYLKTPNQQRYIQNIIDHTISFGIGPAGTGKTFLAVAVALSQLLSGEIRKIILARPVVEAGENLGFLPGSLEEKIAPYLRPLVDAMEQILSREEVHKLLEKKVIEVLPLAYMRGRSLPHAFIILDEAQNTSITQMKMFLTRIGNGTKMVITGDLTQKDIPHKISSGLDIASKILEKTPHISITHFQEKDSVRHPIIKKILKAFSVFEEKQGNSSV